MEINPQEKELDGRIRNLANSITLAISLSFFMGILSSSLLISFLSAIVSTLIIIVSLLLLIILPEILRPFNFLNIKLPLDCFSRFEYISFTATTFLFGGIATLSVRALINGGEYTGLYLFGISHIIYHSGEFLFVCHCHMECLGWNSFLINHSWSYFLAITSGFIEYFLGWHYFPDFKGSLITTLLGCGFMAVGHVFRLGSFISARSNFHHKVQFHKNPNHRLVTTGIYRFSRHPSYFGFFMFALGSQIILSNVICLILHAYTLWIFFYERIEVEEETLRRFFGYQYVEYSTRTPILIPFIEKRLGKSK